MPENKDRIFYKSKLHCDTRNEVIIPLKIEVVSGTMIFFASRH